MRYSGWGYKVGICEEVDGAIGELLCIDVCPFFRRDWHFRIRR